MYGDVERVTKKKLIANSLVVLMGGLWSLVYADDTTTAPKPAATTAAADGPAEGCNPGSENESFWQRLGDSYKATTVTGAGTTSNTP